MALIIDSTTYTLVINSADKISGTNNNATFQVNWMDFLPLKYSLYKIAFSYQTVGGSYSDGTFSSSGLYSNNVNQGLLSTGTNIGSTSINVSSIGTVTVGMYVVGPYFSFGSYVTAVGTSTIQISLPTILALPTVGSNYYIQFYSSTATTLQSLSAVSSINTTTLTMASTTGVLVGQVVIGNSFQSGTTVTVVNSATSLTISLPTIQTSPAGTLVSFYNPSTVNSMVLSSARVLLLNQGRTFTFDTQTKGPSTNLGILQRDIQLANSKSNSLSCFYCQNPPRVIARPYVNLIQINIMNNSTFSGGIVNYNNGTPVFGTTATNQNFLTDTNSNGNTIFNDMTAYTMLIEFIPIANSVII
jgi:hypothetical protein